MALLEQTQQQYYSGDRKTFTGDGTTQTFTIANSINTFPTSYNHTNIKVYFDNVLQLAIDSQGISNYTFGWNITNGWRIYFATAPTSGVAIAVDVDNSFGN